ncbi:MAG: PBECR2 nuclease fold domain-containing protein [Pontibacterium sp.]
MKPVDWQQGIKDKRIHGVPVGPVAKPALPAPAPISTRTILPDDLNDADYAQAFLDEFEQQGVFIDATGEPLMINDQLFRDGAGNLKVSKDRIRHRYMKLLARALMEPDEIWALLETDNATPGKYRVKRRYIKRWMASPYMALARLNTGKGSGKGIQSLHRIENRKAQKYL